MTSLSRSARSLQLFALLAITLLLPIICRLLIEDTDWTSLAFLQGVMSDCFIGLLLAFIASRLPWYLSGLLLVLWSFLMLANLDLINSVGRQIETPDFKFILDPDFLAGSASGISLGKMATYGVLLLLIGIFAVLQKKDKLAMPVFGTLLLSGLCYGGFALVAWKTDNQYAEALTYNPVHNFASKAWYADNAEPEAVTQGNFNPDSAGTPVPAPQNDAPSRLASHKAKNIILIAMEGITGAYLRQNQEYFGLEDIPITMTNLSDIADKGMVVPNFVTHAHKTIRGLYSIHCGRPSKLSNETAKAFQVIANPEHGKNCLPNILAKHGYSTNFLQAARLEFMSKDRFMPEIGFQEVHGQRWFNQRGFRNTIDFGWGVDDQTFFTGALSYIRDLQDQDKPFFLSMLTVGTHHPYAVDESLVQNFESKKLASVIRADGALKAFYEGLRDSGVLEDTLVIFTSDESHGVRGYKYGGSWGSAVILSPDQLPAHVDGLYSLADYPASILDYLGINPESPVSGNSMFREQITPYSVFAYTNGRLRKFNSDMTVDECDHQRQCTEYVADNGRIFDKSYKANRTLESAATNAIYRQARQINQELANKTGTELFRLITDKDFELPADEQITIIDGQYFMFRPGQEVTIEMELEADPDNRDGIQLRYETKIGYRVTDHPKLKFPVLYPGESTKLTYSFIPETTILGFRSRLFAKSRGIDAGLQVKAFTVTIADKPEVGEPFHLDIFATRKLWSTEPSFMKVTLGRPLEFADGEYGTNLLIDGWSTPEDFGTWSMEPVANLGFSLEEGVGRPLSLEIEATPFLGGDHRTQTVDVFFNHQKIDTLQYDITDEDSLRSIEIPGTLVKEENRMNFAIANPVSPQSLGIGADTRPLGIALKEMTVYAADDTRIFQRVQSMLAENDYYDRSFQPLKKPRVADTPTTHKDTVFLSEKLTPGKKYLFTDISVSPFLIQGWSFVEPEGVWGENGEQTLAFNLDGDDLPEAGNVVLKLESKAYVPHKDYVQEIHVAVNGQEIASLDYNFDNQRRTDRIRIPVEWLRRDRLNTVVFTNTTNTAPIEHEESFDARKLAIGLVSVELEIQGPVSDEN